MKSSFTADVYRSFTDFRVTLMQNKTKIKFIQIKSYFCRLFKVSSLDIFLWYMQKKPVESSQVSQLFCTSSHYFLFMQQAVPKIECKTGVSLSPSQKRSKESSSTTRVFRENDAWFIEEVKKKERTTRIFLIELTHF